MDIKTAALGHTYSVEELADNFQMIYGGVAWPTERPGCAVVLGMGREKRFKNYPIYLLEEFESMDLRKLVWECGAFHFQYRPSQWIGSQPNESAHRFIQEMNEEFETRLEQSNEDGQDFYPSSTPITEKDSPYPYMLGSLKRLLDESRRMLFLKDSRVLDYLGGIEPTEVATLELGSYPGIEALAGAVLWLRRYGEEVDKPVRKGPDKPMSAMAC